MATTGDYGSDTLTLAGHSIAVRFQYLPGGIETLIKNYRAKNEPGSAETQVVVEGVVDLKVDGKVVNLKSKTPFPRIRDRETGQTLIEFLLSQIVEEETWLAVKWPDLFQAYRPNENVDEKDPTQPRRGATTDK